MFIRAALIILSGFLFIFSPGIPFALLTRRTPSINRDLIFWGIGIWLVAFLLGSFIFNFLRQLVLGSQIALSNSWQLLLLNTTIIALFILGAMALVLYRRREKSSALLPDGLGMGYGIGMIAQVFTGLQFLGVGFRLLYGDTSEPLLANLANISILLLLLNLVSMILFRPALLVVGAVQGVLVGRSLSGGGRFFWLAVLVNVTFSWAILALHMILGGSSSAQVSLGDTNALISVVTIIYYILAYYLAYRWLQTQIASWSQVVNNKRRK